MDMGCVATLHIKWMHISKIGRFIAYSLTLRFFLFVKKYVMLLCELNFRFYFFLKFWNVDWKEMNKSIINNCRIRRTWKGFTLYYVFLYIKYQLTKILYESIKVFHTFSLMALSLIKMTYAKFNLFISKVVLIVVQMVTFYTKHKFKYRYDERHKL